MLEKYVGNLQKPHEKQAVILDGYAISRQYRGHGYGTILLKSLIDIAKSGNCPELLATVKKYNYASKRVMEKCSGELVRETDERWYYRLG